MMVQSDGCTKREHLESVQRQRGIQLEELKIPELPKSCTDVWKWFLALNSSRGSGLSVSPISYTDMKSYFDLIDIRPTEDEISLVKLLDNILLDIYSKKQQTNNKKPN